MELLQHVASYTLQFFLWFMIGRVVLAVITGGRRTFITDLFRLATFPPEWVVRRLTPSFVGDGHIPLLSIPLLWALYILVRPL